MRIRGSRPSDRPPYGRGRRSYAYLLRKLHFSLCRGPRRPPGGCFLQLFGTFAPRRPPTKLFPCRRGMRSCEYLLWLRHLILCHVTHGLFRTLNPVHIYYTFCTLASAIAFLKSCALPILCICAAHSCPRLVRCHLAALFGAHSGGCGESGTAQSRPRCLFGHTPFAHVHDFFCLH